MAGQDDVLSLVGDNDADSDFSGFEAEDIVRDEVTIKKKSKTKSSNRNKNVNVNASSSTKQSKNIVAEKENLPNVSSAKQSSAKGSSAANPAKGKALKSKKNNVMDLDNLSDSDISKLKELLGFQDPFLPAEEEDLPYLFGDSLENLPNMHIEVENEECSDTEVIPMSNNEKIPPRQAIDSEINGALFDTESVKNSGSEDEFAWQLPKLKTPAKGEPISTSLASLINAACTSQCETDDIVSRYKLPSNCEKLAPPLVNAEIWNDMPKRAQTYDKSFRDIQSLIATGILPIIKLASLLKPQIKSNVEAKTMIADALTLFGQAQYNLSLRRRYMIRPQLKKKYSNLCNINTPITTSLFGDDVQKEIKKCDTSQTVTKDGGYNYVSYGNGSYGANQRYRGRYRGRGVPQRGYYGNGGYGRGYYRYQPYARQPQYKGQTQYVVAKKGKKLATATSPEDMTA